ncbi:hypothetical protein B7G54_17855 [Burkholderia puraquae]|uniref:Uncharacterized protein n=1 Tax=Burkholderia puraquae TaxID=1904757 RepID=A0A1X1PFX9_9BURK|nr:hypothetical protein B7G54_17855 [Burkholderia puraquae]
MTHVNVPTGGASTGCLNDVVSERPVCSGAGSASCLPAALPMPPRLAVDDAFILDRTARRALTEVNAHRGTALAVGTSRRLAFDGGAHRQRPNVRVWSS